MQACITFYMCFYVGIFEKDTANGIAAHIPEAGYCVYHSIATKTEYLLSV